MKLMKIITKFILNLTSVGSIVLIATLNPSQFAVMGQVIPGLPAGDKPPTESGGPRFIQPTENIDAPPPGRIRSVRGGCASSSQLSLTALVPKNKIGRTVSTNPNHPLTIHTRNTTNPPNTPTQTKNNTPPIHIQTPRKQKHTSPKKTQQPTHPTTQNNHQHQQTTKQPPPSHHKPPPHTTQSHSPKSKNKIPKAKTTNLTTSIPNHPEQKPQTITTHQHTIHNHITATSPQPTQTTTDHQR
jgi:hypothetical protein